MKKRDYGLDVLRIISCYLIIVLHVSGHYPNFAALDYKIIQGINRPALWCFVALSGYFLFSRKIDHHFGKFYYTRIFHLFIPLLVYTWIPQIIRGENLSLAVLYRDTVGHLWFVYSITAIYLLAPFIQRMLENINTKELIVLLVLMFVFGRVIPIIENLGYDTSFDNSILGNVMLYYSLLGYTMRQVDVTKNRRLYLLFGIISGLVSIALTVYTFGDVRFVKGNCDLSLGMTMGVISGFILSKWFNSMVKFPKIIEKCITFISERTYGIYILHMSVFWQFTVHNWMPLNLDYTPLQRAGLLALKCLCIFLISFVVSIVFDLLFCKPIEKAMNKVWKF